MKRNKKGTTWCLGYQPQQFRHQRTLSLWPRQGCEKLQGRLRRLRAAIHDLCLRRRGEAGAGARSRGGGGESRGLQPQSQQRVHRLRAQAPGGRKGIPALANPAPLALRPGLGSRHLDIAWRLRMRCQLANLLGAMPWSSCKHVLRRFLGGKCKQPGANHTCSPKLTVYLLREAGCCACSSSCFAMPRSRTLTVCLLP